MGAVAVAIDLATFYVHVLSYRYVHTYMYIHVNLGIPTHVHVRTCTCTHVNLCKKCRSKLFRGTGGGGVCEK